VTANGLSGNDAWMEAQGIAQFLECAGSVYADGSGMGSK